MEFRRVLFRSDPGRRRLGLGVEIQIGLRDLVGDSGALKLSTCEHEILNAKAGLRDQILGWRRSHRRRGASQAVTNPDFVIDLLEVYLDPRAAGVEGHAMNEAFPDLFPPRIESGKVPPEPIA